MPIESLTSTDEAVVAQQLQRPPRGLLGVAYRCPAGHPAVVATAPRLPNGTPFPTTFYLTCPRAVSACSTLEASGLMSELTARIATEPELAARYAAAHRAYLQARAQLAAEITGSAGDASLAGTAAPAGLAGTAALAGLAGTAAPAGEVSEIADVSAGGMPTRVKCLHALLGHTLAAGPGVNPIGDLTLELVAARWPFPCRNDS